MRSFLIISFILVLSINNLAAQPVLSLNPVIATGLSSPMQLVHAGDGSKRIFIVQKDGTILVFNKAYGLIGTFLTVTGIQSGGERGLLSLAFHPNYASNGLLYVYYNNSNGDLQLARYSVKASDPNAADPLSKDTLITIPHPNNSNHNGGELHFGNDGYLYLSTGDGGGTGDVPNNAQSPDILLGKILRFAVNTSDISPYYTIPAGNPFGSEIFAYGLRNPFRWSFDKVTYDMWIGDVGQDSWEEINFRPHDSTTGVNYGWRCYEGNVTYNTSVGCAGPVTNYNFPLYTYATPNPSGAVTGGTVYRGNTYIAFRGYYVATDYYTGIFYIVKYDSLTHTATTTTQAMSFNNMSDFGEAEDGELYAVSLGDNTVYRIDSNGPIGYTFTGNGNWDVAANWSNNAIPPATLPAGAEIIIDPVLNGECVLNIPQTVSAGAKLTVSVGKKFKINGNLTIL
ncbi:MAG: PQQ-dependent sugar dehydrogenase [Ferruginibacter sp.]